MMRSLISGLAIVAFSAGAQPPDPAYEAHVPIRAITEGPEAHWFGYYDKHQFDPSDRLVLAMEVDFEGRKPTADDVVRLGYIDLENGDAWTQFGESRAWSWQQGCMLQWLPGSDSEVIYNDREGDRFVSVVHDVFSGEKRVLPKPVYTVSPDGKSAMGVSFARIDATRDGYGYKGVKDREPDAFAPESYGIYRLNLETGEHETVFTLADVAAISIPMPDNPKGKHWFNHLLYNPDGSRFIFLHRVKWEPDGGRGWYTRMFTAAPDGTDLFAVADHTMVSHFIWRDPRHILAWSKEPETGSNFHLYTDQIDKFEVIGEGVLSRDGHCTYSPDGEWILTDQYPDKNRMQPLMLYRPSDGKLVHLGKFYLERTASAEFRCDLHPRWNRAGTHITIDSMHSGMRQVYLLDVSSVTEVDGEPSS